MPVNNQFQHQTYGPQDPTSPVEWTIAPANQPSAEQAEFNARLAAAGQTYYDAGVRALYLVHGTFAGTDALGLFSELGRFIPQFGEVLRTLGKAAFDAVAGDTGNYSDIFRQQLDEAIDVPIAVRRFNWSSENHHIGRANAAINLLAELLTLDLSPGERIMLWGHSHAGNVFALLTNLLGADCDCRRRFFQLAKSYYRWPLFGGVDVPRWREMADRLCDDNDCHLLADNPLDIVTFGTPIRYGWDAGGYSKLLHIINHHPTEGHPRHRGTFPPKPDDVLSATSGDFVQQLAIAGTDFTPSFFSLRSWVANARLSRLVQPNVRRRDLLANWQHGQKVPNEGQTVLVDYGTADASLKETIAHHIAGHAVYTRRRWLPFHAELVARTFYADD